MDILDKNGNNVSKMETFGNIWKHFHFFLKKSFKKQTITIRKKKLSKMDIFWTTFKKLAIFKIHFYEKKIL